MIDQAKRYSLVFDEVHYHSTIPELVTYYTRLFQKLGIENIRFFHTPAGVY
jgi:hypothetical protein